MNTQKETTKKASAPETRGFSEEYWRAELKAKQTGESYAAMVASRDAPRDNRRNELLDKIGATNVDEALILIERIKAQRDELLAERENMGREYHLAKQTSETNWQAYQEALRLLTKAETLNKKLAHAESLNAELLIRNAELLAEAKLYFAAITGPDYKGKRADDVKASVRFSAAIDNCEATSIYAAEGRAQ